MGDAFKTDFSGVKVHTGNQSDMLNRSISARAFTTGSDIFFRSGEYNPSISSGQTLLAHELTHVVQQGGAPSTAGIQRQTTNNTIQRGWLKNWFGKKSKKNTEDSTTTEPSVESEVQTEEEDTAVDLQLGDAVEYERNLGRYAFNHAKAGSGAMGMINKMSNAMLKDFDKEDEEQRKKLTDLYGKDSISSAGQVGTEFNAVWGAITEGNLREKLTALYNAMYGPFKTYVTQAMKDKSWAEMEEKGLNTTKLKRRKRQMAFNAGATDLYREPGNPLDRKKFKSYTHVGDARTLQDKTSDRTVGDLEQGKHSIGLSDREKSYQFGQEQEESDDISDEKLKWKEGGSYWGVNKKNKWVKKIENSMHMPVVAGPSGSMLRMFQLWEFLNKPVDAAEWRLAVLGWMLSSNDHSFHEMMTTAADYGLPYEPGQNSYMNISPLTVWELRDNVTKAGLFPHEMAFKRKTDSGSFHMLEEADLEDATEDLGYLEKEDKGAVSAPAAAMIRLYSEFGYLLLNPTKEGGMLMKKKIKNAIENKKELKHIKKGIENGEYTVDNLIEETKEMMPMMESALDMVPDWSGDLFRGEGTFSPWSYRTGSTFSFGKFGSSTTDESVAKDFADNYNKGPFKYILKMKVTAGKDIRKFAAYAEDEILMPPGSKFSVTGKNKVDGYTYVEMSQIGRGGNKLDLGEHNEVENEPLTLGPTLAYYKNKYDMDPIGVFLDEFEADYITIEAVEGEWTEFHYGKSNNWYWADTSNLDAFMNPKKVNVLDDSPKLSENAQLLTPALNKPITFSSMGGIEYESIDQPTHIEILDDLYPDGLDGWENVEVKNLDSGQIGYINFVDLKKYLAAKTDLESEEEPKFDEAFAKVPEIMKNITFNAGKTVMGSKQPEQEKNIKVTFVEEPSKDVETEIPLKMFKIICTDDLRLQGVAQIQPAGFGSRTYYIGLGELFNLTTGDPMVGNKAVEVSESPSESLVEEDNSYGLPPSFTFDIINMLQSGGDPEMLVSMGMMYTSTFTSLTDSQVLALSKVMGISKIEVEEQIADL